MKLTESPLKWTLGLLTGSIAILSPNTVASFFGALWASSGNLFTLVSLGALTLPPHIPPESSTDVLVLVVGALFVARVAERVWVKFDRRL